MAQTIVQNDFCKVVLESGDLIKNLSCRVSAVTQTMFDQTQTQYQVPVGRKFIPLTATIIHNQQAASNAYLLHNGTIDSDVGATYFAFSDGAKIDTSVVVTVPLYAEIAAGEYVSAKEAGGSEFTFLVQGVETDA